MRGEGWALSIRTGMWRKSFSTASRRIEPMSRLLQPGRSRVSGGLKSASKDSPRQTPPQLLRRTDARRHTGPNTAPAFRKLAIQRKQESNGVVLFRHSIGCAHRFVQLFVRVLERMHPGPFQASVQLSQSPCLIISYELSSRSSRPA
jgi:hypothetical protein